MRNLKQEEIDQALDDNYEGESGYRPVEATVEELAALGCKTTCGTKPQTSIFQQLVISGYPKSALCRGWYISHDPFWSCPTVAGMFHIECEHEKQAEMIQNMAGMYNGSLRSSGKSLWKGFWEFEIE